MSWTDDWYPSMIAAIGELRGTGAPGTDGAPLPLLHAVDTIGVLGAFSPAVVGSVQRFMGQVDGAYADRVIKTGSVGLGDDGVYDGPIATLPLALANGITVKQWAAGYGGVPGAYRRSVSIGGQTYEPWLISTSVTGDETQLLSFVHELADHWQRVIDAASSSIMACSMDINAVIPSDELATFWSAVRRLCSTLDVLRENPPQSVASKIKAASLEALHASEKFAGEAAADLATEAGKAAGNVTSGFFSAAGVTSLVVAGIAVYLFVS